MHSDNVIYGPFRSWAVFHLVVGLFGCSCGSFWSYVKFMSRFGLGRFGSGPFWSFRLQTNTKSFKCTVSQKTAKLFSS